VLFPANRSPITPRDPDLPTQVPGLKKRNKDRNEEGRRQPRANGFPSRKTVKSQRVVVGLLAAVANQGCRRAEMQRK